MSISLGDHENRIVALESKSFNHVILLNNYITLSKTDDDITFDIGQYLDWDMVFFRYDHWGDNCPEYDSTDAFIPLQLCKHMWVATSQLWLNKNGCTDGVQCNLVGNKLHVRYWGGEGGSGLRSLGLLKLYYSFSYNIIYKAKHFLEKIFMS